MFTLIGAGVLVYLKKNSFIGVVSIHDGALIGGVSGFAAFIVAAIINLPFNLWMFSSSLTAGGKNLFDSVSTFAISTFLIILLILFLGLLIALFNAFGGIIVAYLYEKLEKPPDKEDIEFIIK